MKEEKRTRHFSEAFKMEKVKMIEEKQMTVIQLSRIYQVTRSAIYKWIRKYSTKISKREILVMEKESEGAKTLELHNLVSELERKVGQKQLQIDYLEKVLELGSEEVGFDIKKSTHPGTQLFQVKAKGVRDKDGKYIYNIRYKPSRVL